MREGGSCAADRTLTLPAGEKMRNLEQVRFSLELPQSREMRGEKNYHTQGGHIIMAKFLTLPYSIS